MQLQEEIVNTENKLAYAKQAFNDSIERYNATKKSFFEAWVVSLFVDNWINNLLIGALMKIPACNRKDIPLNFKDHNHEPNHHGLACEST